MIIHWSILLSLYDRGSFDEHGSLIKGQKVAIKSVGCTEHGLIQIEYSEPIKPDVYYHYKPPTPTTLGDQPTVGDEIAEDYVQVRSINYFKVNTNFSS